MKYLLVLPLVAAALLRPLAAQDAPPKPVRKTLSFTADGASADAPKASPAAKSPEKSAAAATPKTTPRPTPKSAEKSAAKPGEKQR